jgi:methionyl aminopeptidase
MIKRHAQADIAKMRSAGRIVAEVLALVEESLEPGVSTADLDRLAERHIRDSGATPSFQDYMGGRRYDPRDPRRYRAATCISIDHEIVHGIPGDREIKAGQIVSVDVGAIYREWHADGARSFICGGPGAGSPEAVRLVETTRLGLMAGVAATRAGNHLDDIGGAIEDVAVEAGYGIVRGYTGHGIGTSMHDDPSVFNFRTGRPGARLEVGMCLAIEPMYMIGEEDTEVLRDGWTVVTADRSLAAHFEHTVAVTAQGPEILTRA